MYNFPNNQEEITLCVCPETFKVKNYVDDEPGKKWKHVMVTIMLLRVSSNFRKVTKLEFVPIMQPHPSLLLCRKKIRYKIHYNCIIISARAVLGEYWPEVLFVWSECNKRFISRLLKVFRKNPSIIDWKDTINVK